MVVLRVKGQEIALSSAAYKLDLREYYMYLLVKVPIYIPVGEQVGFVFNNKESAMFVRESTYFEPLYQLKLVSQKQKESLTLKTKEYQGESTVRNLLASIGAKASITQDTIKSWWMLPKLPITDLIKYLNKYAVPSNGGAPRFYLDLDGNIQYIDLVVKAKDRPEEMKAQVLEDIQSTDWSLEIPGTLGVVCSNVESDLYSEVVCDETLSYGIQFAVDTTGKYTSLLKQAYKNDFNWRKYSKRCVSVTNIASGPHSVGQYVSVGGVKGVIISYTQPVQLNQEFSLASALIVCPE